MPVLWIREWNGIALRANKVWILCLGPLYFIFCINCSAPSLFLSHRITIQCVCVVLILSVRFCFSLFFCARSLSTEIFLCTILLRLWDTFPRGKQKRCFIICIKCLWCAQTIGIFQLSFSYNFLCCCCCLSVAIALCLTLGLPHRLHFIRNVFLHFNSLCLCVHLFFFFWNNLRAQFSLV